ncbi:MAG: metallophosphoesterase [Pseudomonadota bacterium]
MRIFAVSDLHVDYAPNRAWIDALSKVDYQRDALLVAGDLSHKPERLLRAMAALRARFARVLFVPGNHDLWVPRDSEETSLERHAFLRTALAQLDVDQDAFEFAGARIVPLLSWYDYSFGAPGPKLRKAWSDFHRCRWPDGWEAPQISAHFAASHPKPVALDPLPLITVSHFLPRPDVLPMPAIMAFGWILPVLGGWRLEQSLRRWHVQAIGHTHLYGHSHVNVDRTLSGIRYLNNARGYPNEPRYRERRLLEVPVPGR